jgi:UDP-N-acetylmuramoyl-tripeptide--D-alanyl-D-alanine ligase
MTGKLPEPYWPLWERLGPETMTPYTWSTRQLLQATDGSLLSGSEHAVFGGIGIDSRTIAAGQLFVAIVGETHDGHRFVNDVLDRGAAGVLVDVDKATSSSIDLMKDKGIVCVAVTDTTRALGDLARFNRNRGELKVLGITGSNGKTSTRVLMDLVISQGVETLSTAGNLNNHIGLPLTLFRLSPSHQAAVLEMGMNHPGEIETLGKICEPDIGVITNVGPAHLEGLGSLENIAQAKGELLHTLRADGTAILNLDDPLVAGLADAVDQAVVFFGQNREAQVRAEAVVLIEGKTSFTLATPFGSIPVTLQTPARVMVSNALAAAAAGVVMGIPLSGIKSGLESFSPGAGRMGIRHLNRQLCLVDDTYNANPSSMIAAIETLPRMCEGRRMIAVLGDMLELGPQSAALHKKVGQAVGKARIDLLFATGHFAAEVTAGAMDRGMKSNRIFKGTKEAIIEQLNLVLQPEDLILIKGSRGMAMEAVVEGVCRWAARE